MAAARVSIPEVARRIIEDIKEIAGGHADVEVYAVLRECDMDPNEATQRLLSRGTFHEVKRKRDKKKESRKESVDPRLRPGVQDRDVKGWQGNYSSHLSGRKPLVGKEIGVNQNMDKENSIFMKRNMEPKTSTFSQSLSGGLSNDPSQHVAPIEENYAAVGHFLSSDSKRSADLEDTKDVSTSVLDVNQSVQPSPSISRLHISAVEPIPTPSLEAHSNGDICSTEHDENQQTAGVQEEKMIPSWGRTPMSRIRCKMGK